MIGTVLLADRTRGSCIGIFPIVYAGKTAIGADTRCPIVGAVLSACRAVVKSCVNAELKNVLTTRAAIFADTVSPLVYASCTAILAGVTIEIVCLDRSFG